MSDHPKDKIAGVNGLIAGILDGQAALAFIICQYAELDVEAFAGLLEGALNAGSSTSSPQYDEGRRVAAARMVESLRRFKAREDAKAKRPELTVHAGGLVARSEDDGSDADR